MIDVLVAGISGLRLLRAIFEDNTTPIPGSLRV